MKNKIIGISLLAVLTSCGGSGGGGSAAPFVPLEIPAAQPSQPQPEEARAPDLVLDGSNIQGVYLAKFTTLNGRVVGTIPGSAQFRRVGDTLWSYVRLFAGSPDTAHFQNVHTGSRCPVLPADDKNADGYIDIQEALAVVGPVLVPLDADISNQLAGGMYWSKALPNGSYEYMKDTSFEKFLANLRDEDENPIDNITKASAEAPFEFTGKVVLIQGVGKDLALPASVLSVKRYTNQQTLPIACGVFNPSPTESGVVYEDVITGPVANVEEGADQPAPEGADEIPGPIVTPPETGETPSPHTETTEPGTVPPTGPVISEPIPVEPAPVDPEVKPEVKPETETQPNP